MNIEFDGENLLIKVNQGVTTLDIQTDIYSAWKEWIQVADNSKFLLAIRTIGGDPTVQEKVVAPYFFLMNGWKIKPASWTHTLNLIGNLFVDNPEIYGSNIVVPPDGNYTVLVNMSTTSDASKVVTGSGVTQQDKEDISDMVHEKTGGELSSQLDEVSYQVYGISGQVFEAQEQVMNIEKHHILRRKIDGDYIKYYDGDTLVMKYRIIKDGEGRIIELIPEEI